LKRKDVHLQLYKRAETQNYFQSFILKVYTYSIKKWYSEDMYMDFLNRANWI